MDTSTDTAVFLRAVFALYDDDLPITQRIGICTRTNNKGDAPKHFLQKTPELASVKVQNIGKSLHCYFETCTNPLKVSGKRLSSKEAQATGNLHLDIDIQSPYRGKENLPPTQEAALTALSPLWELLPPSITVYSGYGLQVYWCFKEPCDLTCENERKEYKDANRALYQYALKLMQNAGYELDNVGDLAHLMRIPGGYNIKNPDDPRQVTFVDHGPRYNPSDIIDELPDMPEEEKPAVVDVDASPLSVDPSEVLRAIDAWRDISPEVDAAWRCKRTDGDTSLSGQVQKLISGVCANDPDKLIPDAYLRYAIEEFYKRHGRDNAHKAKGRRKDFQDATIRLARGNCLTTRSQDAARQQITAANAQVSAAVYEGGLEAANKAAKEVSPMLLDAVSQQIGCKVLAVKKYMTEPATYVIETNMGDVELGTSDAMLSKAKFEARLMDLTRQVLDLKKKDRLALVQAILNAATTVELGPEATEAGMLAAQVRRYIETNGIREDVEAAYCESFRKAFRYNGGIWFRLESLHEYMRMSHIKVDAGTSKLLTQAGFTRESVNIQLPDGSRTTRSAWRCPDGLDFELDQIALAKASGNPINMLIDDE